MKKILEREEIMCMIEEHYKWLDSKGKNGERADFTSCDLSVNGDKLFESGDFTEACFNHSDVSGLTFEGSNLTNASFWKANATYCNFTETNLKNTDFSEGCFKCSLFNEATFDETNICDVDMRRGEFENTVIKSVIQNKWTAVYWNMRGCDYVEQ